MNKILIFKPDNIGDVILFSGALKYLRQQFPKSHITLAVQQHIIELVEFCPYIDKFISIESLEPYDGNLDREGVRPILQRVRRLFIRDYNLIIYPVRAPQIRHLAILKKISAWRISGFTGCNINAISGYPTGFDPKDLLTDSFDLSKRDPWEHELLVLPAYLAHLGVNLPHAVRLIPEFWFSSKDHSLISDHLCKDGPVLGIFPFSSGKERCWPTENYPSLLRSLPMVRTVVLLGGIGNKAAAEDLKACLLTGAPAVKVIDLTGKTSLRQLVLTIMDCSVLLSVDSSGLHIGLASETPSIGIVGAGHYGMFVPWGNIDRAIFLTKPLDCFNCNWGCRRETIECICGVTPEQVALAVEKLLEPQQSDRD
jgi:ADP-heptose:LPS heptosyltransferase